jgi:plasmid stabilization system protein ParE
VKVIISKRATRAAERIAARWEEHADYRGVFSREFLEAIDLLETTPGPGAPFPTLRHPELKRLLLRKSRCHLYFEIDERRQTIRILHVWDGRRERPPSL